MTLLMGMKKQKQFGRGAGVLMPVSSFASSYGIGTFGVEAYKFIDFLEKGKQKYWQVLPIGPTSYGDSPYQSFSAFAGNPYFIDLDILVEEKLLKKSDITGYAWGNSPVHVRYGAIYNSRFKVLRLAYTNSKHKETQGYVNFCKDNDWLDDYSLFMTLKNHFGGVEWQKWPEKLRMRDKEMLAECVEQFEEDIDFWRFCQYKFFCQWNKLKEYANKKKIQIIGDIPIYVAMDSADVWVNHSLFQLDEDRFPTAIAGVPPDMFSQDGQLWGNPLYKWDVMEQDDFAWWQKRMSASAKLYDIIRIDHFIGIVNYFSVPANATTAIDGCWMKGPGEKLIEAITPVLGKKKIIAEDLGIVTPDVIKLLKKSGYPGMKLMEFAFDSDSKNPALPCNFDQNIVAYGGTHDNEPLVGFYQNQNKKMITYAKEYLNLNNKKDIPKGIIREGYASCADTVIFQMQDLLGYGNESRLNTPSTLGGNWEWRIQPNVLDDFMAEQLSDMVRIYGR